MKDTRAWLALPENDFCWSSWEDVDAALAEVDRHLAAIRAQQPVNLAGISVLFAPTGPIQEVAVHSGWGDESLALGDRADKLLAMRPCRCQTGPTCPRETLRHLGMDPHYGQVSVQRCEACGQHWLRYEYELEAVSRSGRWFLGAITAAQADAVTVESAQAALEGLRWYFQGGSYFAGRTSRSAGPLPLS